MGVMPALVWMSRDIHGRMLAREPCPLIRALSAERPHQNEHHRKPGEKPKMHPPFEFGLARPSPITVIDQERSQHTCERDEDQPGPAHSGRRRFPTRVALSPTEHGGQRDTVGTTQLVNRPLTFSPLFWHCRSPVPSESYAGAAACCCARVASGHVTAVPPTSVMKSRRLMIVASGPRGQGVPSSSCP